MGFIEIILIGIGLAMDAFAVSICKGLCINNNNLKIAIKIAMYFGIFQAVMPALGFIIGTKCNIFVENIDHWIAFILLSAIGINMIINSFSNEKENDKLDIKTMLFLALATSIDALTVGITFSFFEINIVYAVLIIGCITYVLSAIGVFIGNIFGKKLKSKAEILGGIILILIGTKILLEHLGVLFIDLQA